MLAVKTKIAKNRFPQLKGAIRRQVVKVVNETAEEVLDIACQLVPVDTGELKESGHLEPYNQGELNRVVFDAEHARFVEYGTSVSAAQPFLRPAAEAVKKRLNRRLGQIQAGLAREIGKSNAGK